MLEGHPNANAFCEGLRVLDSKQSAFILQSRKLLEVNDTAKITIWSCLGPSS